MKYRKKPVVIEAIQWNGNNEQQIRNFVGNPNLQVSRPPSQFGLDYDLTDDMVTIIIPTMEGDMRANRFDYIIKGVVGEHYPCKPEIFLATYEPVNE